MWGKKLGQSCIKAMLEFKVAWEEEEKWFTGQEWIRIFVFFNTSRCSQDILRIMERLSSKSCSKYYEEGSPCRDISKPYSVGLSKHYFWRHWKLSCSTALWSEPTSSRLLIHEASVHQLLKERRAKQAYYYNKGGRELNRVKPGDVVHVKLRPNSQEWTKAAVHGEV